MNIKIEDTIKTNNAKIDPNSKILALPTIAIYSRFDETSLLPSGRHPIVIVQGIAEVLKLFADQGYKIALLTKHTINNDDFDYWKSEFEKNNIAQYITFYHPPTFDPTPDPEKNYQSQLGILEEYASKLGVPNQNFVSVLYPRHIRDAINAGFSSSFNLSDKDLVSSLTAHLDSNDNRNSNSSHLDDSPSKLGFSRTN